MEWNSWKNRKNRRMRLGLTRVYFFPLGAKGQDRGRDMGMTCTKNMLRNCPLWEKIINYESSIWVQRSCGCHAGLWEWQRCGWTSIDDSNAWWRLWQVCLGSGLKSSNPKPVISPLPFGSAGRKKWKNRMLSEGSIFGEEDIVNSVSGR